LTITGNNSEVKRIIASSIESKNLIRETSSDNLQIIQIDTQESQRRRRSSQVLELLRS
jgi:hypothetical protein